MIHREPQIVRPLLCCLAALLCAPALPAQQETTPVSLDNLPTETLHVYANRMQFPTLLIDNSERSIPQVNLHDFNLTLDSGPVFHPSGVHIEGDDPLDIAILIDLSGGGQKLLSRLPDALASLAPDDLHSQDHLHFYALDCTLIGLSSPIAAEPNAIRYAVTATLAAPVHGVGQPASCSPSLRLWDAITRVSQSIAGLPSRRVLLVISPGVNHGKLTTLTQMAHDVNANAVAVFGLRDIHEFFSSHHAPEPADIHTVSHIPNLIIDSEDPFVDLCLRSGGFVLNVDPSGLKRRLRNLIALLRERYVLEFPRPDNNFSGWHSLIVKVPAAPFALPTGDSAPLPDNKLLQSPDTIPTRPSPAVVGKRHVLESTHP